jgi:transforming growth factor-beta-induced protein
VCGRWHRYTGSSPAPILGTDRSFSLFETAILLSPLTIIVEFLSSPHLAAVISTKIIIIDTADIACSLEQLSTLCTAIGLAGLGGNLSEGNWTVFAPTNDAFDVPALGGVIANVQVLTDILLFHTVSDVVLASSDLSCEQEMGGNAVGMTNGEDSFTVCVGGVPTFQAGGANLEGTLPAIIAADVPACNGLIHVVDNVLLYNMTD